jgi:hypothetical protein
MRFGGRVQDAGYGPPPDPPAPPPLPDPPVPPVPPVPPHSQCQSRNGTARKPNPAPRQSRSPRRLHNRSLRRSRCGCRIIDPAQQTRGRVERAGTPSIHRHSVCSTRRHRCCCPYRRAGCTSCPGGLRLRHRLAHRPTLSKQPCWCWRAVRRSMCDSMRSGASPAPGFRGSGGSRRSSLQRITDDVLLCRIVVRERQAHLSREDDGVCSGIIP